MKECFEIVYGKITDIFALLEALPEIGKGRVCSPKIPRYNTL